MKCTCGQVAELGEWTIGDYFFIICKCGIEVGNVRAELTKEQVITKWNKEQDDRRRSTEL